MQFTTDDQLNDFRRQSDRSFLTMQASADNEMATFLKSYGEGYGAMDSFQTPDMSWGVAPAPFIQTAGGAVRQKVRKVAAAGEKIAEKLTGRKARQGAAGGPKTELFDDFGELGASVKGDMEATAQGAAQGARSWLQNTTMDLGERAKREAAAMRDAARKAMQEETSLRGLKERAQAELQAAKLRVQAELLDVKADAVADLEGRAIDTLGQAQEHGFQAAEAAHKRAQLELDDLLGGGNKT